jgi:hypothetical protein
MMMVVDERDSGIVSRTYGGMFEAAVEMKYKPKREKKKGEKMELDIIIVKVGRHTPHVMFLIRSTGLFGFTKTRLGRAASANINDVTLETLYLVSSSVM